jgi:hypothetical protein
MVFAVTPMPANPVSPFRAVKVERYVPGGGSNGVGDVVVGVVEEEHAPMSSVQTMKEARNRIDRSRSVALVHAGLFVIEYPLVSKSENQTPKRQMGEKGPKIGQFL